MGYLRKASYQDIIGCNKKNQFNYYDNITTRYKEFELYLTQDDLEILTNDNCDNEELKKLIEILNNDSAVISAIHCPESCFRTCNEKETEMSSNYLSLCEIISDNDSLGIFKKLIRLADNICKRQNNNTITTGNDDDDEEVISTVEKDNNKQIIVIIHEGCERGCIVDEKNTCCKEGNFVDKICEKVKDIKTTSSIRLAIENITPFYGDTKVDIEKGKNCGWNKDNQICKEQFFKTVNQILGEKKINIQFGACIDFCHVMVSEKILDGDSNIVDVLNNYFNEIDYNEYIYIFHVSNFGKDLSHGKQFLFENEQDKNTLETIRMLCKMSGKDVPITFEMEDGADAEKSKLNYEYIMYYFSNKHIFGNFGKLLNHEVNKDLKEFFDNLFIVYSYDKKNVFEITDALWKVKKIVLDNTFVLDERERLFGFDFDSTEVNFSLVRLKAYVYYTRFCNLGIFLADGYYSGENCIWDEESCSDIIAKDFGLALKYFMFNDKIHQCVYTGIQYKFLIDFLPKKENFVRFNDGITNTREMKINSGNKIFKQVIDKIPGHISGTTIINGEADFYSVGKNFGQCLFKYFDSSNNNWSLRIYENQPINYVKCSGMIYSIQAFVQLVLQGGFNDETIDLSLDISRFASGRDGGGTDSLKGFLNFFNIEKGFVVEKVASISDEEILFTALPEMKEEFCLSKAQGVILKKIYLEGKWQKGNSHCKLEYTIQNDNADFEETMEKEINKINNEDKHVVWKILDYVKQQYDLKKNNKEELEKLDGYSGNDKCFYEKHSDKIKCNWEVN